MRVLITGGAGFIGSHLADALLGHGDEVHVLDDLSTGTIDNITHLKAPAFDYTIDTVTTSRARGAGRPLRRRLPPRRRRRRQADRRGPGAHDRDQRARHRGRPQGANKKKKQVLIASTSEVYGKSTECRSAKTAIW